MSTSISITTPDEFIALATMSDRGTSSDLISITLENDLDFDGYTVPSMSTLLYCNFDGGEHTIKNITSNGVDFCLLYVGSNSTVSNIKFDNISVTNGSLSGFIKGGNVTRPTVNISNVLFKSTCAFTATTSETSLYMVSNVNRCSKVGFCGTYNSGGNIRFICKDYSRGIVDRCFAIANLYIGASSAESCLVWGIDNFLITFSFTRCSVYCSHNVAWALTMNITTAFTRYCYSADTYTSTNGLWYPNATGGSQSCSNLVDTETNTKGYGYAGRSWIEATTTNLKNAEYLAYLAEDTSTRTKGWVLDGELSGSITTHYPINLRNAYSPNYYQLCSYIRASIPIRITHIEIECAEWGDSSNPAYLDWLLYKNNTNIASGRITCTKFGGYYESLIFPSAIADGIELDVGEYISISTRGYRAQAASSALNGFDYSGDNPMSSAIGGGLSLDTYANYKIDYELLSDEYGWKLDGNNDGYPYIWGFGDIVEGNIYLKTSTGNIPMTAYIKQNGNLIPLTFSGVKGAGI